MGDTQPPQSFQFCLTPQTYSFPVGKEIQALGSVSLECIQAVYCLLAHRTVLPLGKKEKENAGETGCIPIQPPMCDVMQVHQIPELSPLDLFLSEFPTSHLALRTNGCVSACGV